MEPFSSQVTFLNFCDLEAGKAFLQDVLGLEVVYDIGWAVVYGIAGKAFLGAVDRAGSGRAQDRDAMLISLTTGEIEAWHDRIAAKLPGVSPIREVPDAALASFFFTGPEGYRFEIQQFLLPQLQELF